MTNNNNANDDHLPGWLWIPVLLLVFLVAAGFILPPEDYLKWIGSERTGALEISQVLVAIPSVFLATQILFHEKLIRFSWLWFWVLLAALGSFYIAGEEASWGQHWFLWETSENWAALNDQGETNLHNNSPWFDQKPRTLLEIGVVVGGIILPIAQYFKPGLIDKSLSIVVPSFVLLPTALLAELSRRTEPVFEYFEISYQFLYRTSEIQELYFYLFILFYLIVLKQRLNKSKIRLPVPKTSAG